MKMTETYTFNINCFSFCYRSFFLIFIFFINYEVYYKHFLIKIVFHIFVVVTKNGNRTE